MKFRLVSYYFSQYFWLLLLLIPYIPVLVNTRSTYTKKFVSSTNYFNSSKSPIWFLHITDIHLAKLKPKAYNFVLETVNQSINLFKPKKIINSGDIADNYIKNDFRPYIEQDIQDWDCYKKFLKDLNITDPFHVGGNHDVFKIKSFESEKHFANGILYNKSTMLINRIPYVDDDYRIDIITINPYNFPAPELRFTWWIYPKKSQFKKIEKELSDDNIKIVVGHHPSMMWSPSFSKYLSKSNNVRFYLAGHLHTKEYKIKHHKNTIEIVGTPLFRYKKVGLVTIDNDKYGYHSITMDNNRACYSVITNPIPDYQISDLTTFNNITEIRAISFCDKKQNLIYKINNKERELKCNKELDENIYLCSDPIDLTKGKYEIELNDEKFNFTIGETIDSFEEKPYLNESSKSYLVCYLIIVVILIFVTIPFKLFNFTNQIEEYICKETNESRWILSILGCFCVIQSRISKSPYYIRFPLFFFVLWILFLPISFFKIEDCISILWSWGLVSNKISTFNFYGQKYSIFYLYYVIVPIILIISSGSLTRYRSFLIITDFIIYILSIHYIYKTVYLLSNSVSIKYGCSSPVFIFIPIILLILSIIYIFRTIKDKKPPQLNSYIQYKSIPNIEN